MKKLLAVALCVVSAPVWANNKMESEILSEIRALRRDMDEKLDEIHRDVHIKTKEHGCHCHEKPNKNKKQKHNKD